MAIENEKERMPRYRYFWSKSDGLRQKSAKGGEDGIKADSEGTCGATLRRA